MQQRLGTLLGGQGWQAQRARIVRQRFAMGAHELLRHAAVVQKTRALERGHGALTQGCINQTFGMRGIAGIQRGLGLRQIGIGCGRGLRGRQKRGQKNSSQDGCFLHPHPPKSFGNWTIAASPCDETALF